MSDATSTSSAPLPSKTVGQAVLSALFLLLASCLLAWPFVEIFAWPHFCNRASLYAPLAYVPLAVAFGAAAYGLGHFAPWARRLALVLGYLVMVLCCLGIFVGLSVLLIMIMSNAEHGGGLPGVVMWAAMVGWILSGPYEVCWPVLVVSALPALWAIVYLKLRAVRERFRSERKPFQYRLSTLAAVCFFGSIYLGTLWHLQEPWRAAARIAAAGMRIGERPEGIEIDTQWSAKLSDASLRHVCEDMARVPNVVMANFSHTSLSDASMVLLKDSRQLRRLDLRATLVTDAGLANLEGMSNLEELNLGNTQVTDGGLVHLRGLSNLTVLDLLHTRVTDAGLVHLKALPRLQHLELHQTRVSDAGLAQFQQTQAIRFVEKGSDAEEAAGRLRELGGSVYGANSASRFLSVGENTDLRPLGAICKEYFPHVAKLDLDCYKGGDDALAGLAEIKELEDLNLRCARITDTGIAHLKHLTAMRRLNLEHVPITDAGLAALADMTRMEWLNLAHTKVSDAGMAHLQRMTELTELDLERTQVGDAGIACLAPLKKLKRLNVSFAERVTDASIGALKQLPNLQVMRVTQSAITVAGADELQLSLPNVRFENGVFPHSSAAKNPAPAFLLPEALACWLKVEHESVRHGFTATHWMDRSGKKRDWKAPNGNAGPEWVHKGQNDLPVLRYNGVGNEMRCPAFFSGQQEAELFVVLKPSRPQGACNGLWRFHTGPLGSHYPSADGNVEDSFGSAARFSFHGESLVRGFNVYNVSVSSQGAVARVNYAVLCKGPPAKLEWNGKDFVIGNSGPSADGTAWFQGDIGEVLLYSRVLKDEERDLITKYLLKRWSIIAPEKKE